MMHLQMSCINFVLAVSLPICVIVFETNISKLVYTHLSYLQQLPVRNSPSQARLGPSSLRTQSDQHWKLTWWQLVSDRVDPACAKAQLPTEANPTPGRALISPS
jgi:hypothetical protein